MGQCWFIYSVFIKTNDSSPEVLANEGNVNGVLDGLPDDVKQSILGNKAKYDKQKGKIIV